MPLYMHIIAKFYAVLTGYHHRVSYPFEGLAKRSKPVGEKDDISSAFIRYVHIATCIPLQLKEKFVDIAMGSI